jgi:hypothetical protein
LTTEPADADVYEQCVAGSVTAAAEADEVAEADGDAVAETFVVGFFEAAVAFPPPLTSAVVTPAMRPRTQSTASPMPARFRFLRCRSRWTLRCCSKRSRARLRSRSLLPATGSDLPYHDKIGNARVGAFAHDRSRIVPAVRPGTVLSLSVRCTDSA